MLKKIVLLLISLSILSCSSSKSNFSSNAVFQKRQHTKGFYFSGFKSKLKTESTDIARNEELELKEEYNRKEYSANQNTPDSTTITSSSSFEKEVHTEIEQAKIKKPKSQSKLERNELIGVGIEQSASKSKIDDEPLSESVTTKSIAVFFTGILGWVLLIAFIVMLILSLSLILYALVPLGLSLILEAFAYFVGDDLEDKVKAAKVGYSLSMYYWWLMATVLSISLSSLIFII